MRTKTMLISALLGALSSVSVMAQTNVYSLNTVGYINITCYPGWNIISCPLVGSPDNSLNTLLNNTNGQWNGVIGTLYWYTSQGGYANPNNPAPTFASPDGSGWAAGGSGTNLNESIQPGQGVWLDNVTSSNFTVTFVGTVPSGPVTNTLYGDSWNLVSTVVPTSGDLYSNTISVFTNSNPGDTVYFFNPMTQGYAIYSAAPSFTTGNGTVWPNPPGDPSTAYVGEGFWYYNGQPANILWVENYTTSNP